VSVLVVGLSHRSAPVRLLERAAVTRGQLPDVLRTLLAGQHVAEAVVLSTCNRVEVYAVVTGFHGGLNDVGTALSRRAGLELPELADHLYVHYGDEAVRHLFTVGAGLDSMVLGEAQVLGQLRDAYTAAQDCGAPGQVLHELLQQALRVGKRVHAETAIDRAGQSTVSMALEVGEAAVGPVAGHPALVIGAGSVGALAAATLRRAGVGALTVVNRTRAVACRLAATAGARAAGLDELPHLLREVDVVVSATGSAGSVVSASTVAAAQEARGGRPLLVLDLAVPRDVDRAVARVPGVTVVDIEQLGARAGGLQVAEDVDDARAIVAEEVEVFLGWERSMEVAPTVAALRARADELVAAELVRLSARLPRLDPRERQEVEQAVRRVVASVLHTPTVRVKELASAPGGDRYAEVLRELFALDPGAARVSAAVAAVPPDPDPLRAPDPLRPPDPPRAPDALRPPDPPPAAVPAVPAAREGEW